jgi:hypothetical protein
MGFQYPAHPNTDRTDPFSGPDGKNPFADSESPPETAPDNPYAVPIGDGGVSYQPSFEAVCPHRGRTVFWLGASGCLAAVAAVVSVAALWAITSMVTTLVGALCPVLVIAALTLGGTAWMFGRHDLSAIRAGAMDPAGMKITQQGHRLGIAGTLVSVGVVAVFIAAVALR